MAKSKHISEYYYMDEIYTGFYTCPKCGSAEVQRGFKYCPICGIKLLWSKVKKV